MRRFIFKYNRFSLLRDITTLCLLGILAGYMLPLPVIVWRVIFVLLCFLALWKRRNRLYNIEKWMFLLVGLCFFYFLIAHIGITQPSTTLIGAILFTMPACNLFHYLTEKGVITQRWLNIVAIFFLLAGAYFYRYNYIQTVERMLTNPTEEIDITNNASTVFLGLIPFLLLVRNRVIQWGGILVCWFFLLSSGKRGNVLGAVLPTFIFLLPYIKESRHSVWKMLLFIAALVVAIFLGLQWFEQSSMFQKKLELALMGDNSGRTHLYSLYLNLWTSSTSFVALIFGYGFNGTEGLGGNDIHAHNDWIESLFDYGLLGFLLEFMILVSFIRLSMMKSNGQTIMLSIFFIWFEKSMLSMGYMDPMNVFVYVSLGITLFYYYSDMKDAPLSTDSYKIKSKKNHNVKKN